MSSVINDNQNINVNDNQNVERRGHKESQVWDHFYKDSLGSGHYTAKCNFCAKNWTRGRLEILKAHLALYCPNVTLNVKAEYMEILAIESTSANRKKSDTDSSEIIDVNTSDSIDQALIQYFVVCGISFSTVDHPFFIEFVRRLCSNYNLPKRETFSTTLLNKEAATVLKIIQEELKHEENLILGTYIFINLINYYNYFLFILLYFVLL